MINRVVRVIVRPNFCSSILNDVAGVTNLKKIKLNNQIRAADMKSN